MSRRARRRSRSGKANVKGVTVDTLSMRKVMLVVCVLAVGAVLSAQGTRPHLDSSGADALLAEVRALRAEVNDATNASVRMQLLVARLQLQEGRVVAASRQLADARDALAVAQMRINAQRARARQLEDAASRATAQERPALQQAVLEAGAQIEQDERYEQQLQAQETELRRAMDDAQARWTNLNNRLDALEQSLPAASH